MSTISKPILPIVHRFAGGAAFCLIASFWLATIIVELFGTIDQIVMVKTSIVWGLMALVPCLAATGGSGFRLARGQITGLVALKLRRMKLVAANGLLVLVPCAIGLAIMARNGQMDDVFITLQALELFAGLINLVLIGLNIRDGLHMRRPVRTSVTV